MDTVRALPPHITFDISKHMAQVYAPRHGKFPVAKKTWTVHSAALPAHVFYKLMATSLNNCRVLQDTFSYMSWTAEQMRQMYKDSKQALLCSLLGSCIAKTNVVSALTCVRRNDQNTALTKGAGGLKQCKLWHN